jgi:hypothetical protein
VLRRRTLVCLFVGLLSLFVHAGGAWAADKTLDLRVLVVSTGSASTDPGLDLMDDVLNEIGVPYDVLDSSTQTLTPDRLFSGDHGFYNGVILTNSELFLPGGGGSGFDALEWETLHAFERDFGVREAVVSGFPATNPGLGLDYGMTDIIAGTDFQGRWQAPAGGTELYEYVNEANPLPITDFAFAGRPFVIYAGEPRETGVGPHVQPLLVWQNDTQKSFVSYLRYDDGREVLLSTISNAWFLIHSQVLAYEFLNFATKGVFIGSREVYLEAHVDDLFLGNSLWDPAANVTDESREYRLSAGDVQNAVAQTAALRTAHPTAAGFVVDFPFNGSGAALPVDPPTANLRPVADTYIEQDDPYDNHGRDSRGGVQFRSNDEERTLIRFNLAGQPASPVQQATLTLWTDGSNQINAKVCRVTNAWDEGVGYFLSGATWRFRRGITRWTTYGGDYDSAGCIPFRLRNEQPVTIDVTPLASSWLGGASPNNGLIVLGTSFGEGEIGLREQSTSSRRPLLTIDYAPVVPDELTNAVLANKNQFRYMNHTFTHEDMDTSAGLANHAFSTSEIQQNRDMWTSLGLPAKAENDRVLLTGEHSGLGDDMGTELDPTDDLHFPAGKNDQLLQAAQDLGVRYLGSDSSRPGQNAERFVPGFDLMLLPRYPTAIFYNATTPAENTDEYNYIFHERFVNAGQDPCTIPGAICSPRSYEQVLAAEAETTLRHMLAYRKWPHYFHQSNLRNYNGAGSTLLFDWLDAVLDRYESLLVLPVRSLPFYEIGRLSEQRLAAKSSGLRGRLDVATGTVTLQADGPARMPVTGLAGGSLYGGQSIRSVEFGTVPQSFTVDPALGQ